MSNLTKMVNGESVEMTDDEQTEFLAQQATDTVASQISQLKNQVQSILAANDKVATRCVKAGIAYPAEWLAYDQSLRVIVNSGTGKIPTQPSYPEGT